MKSEKGFTLVELLAVIAILAILVVIALPNVVDMFQGAKQGTFKTEVQTLLKQAQQTWVLNGGTDITFKSSCGYTVSTANTKAKLSLQGTEMNYVIHVNAEGNIVEYAISDSSYSIYKKGTNANPLLVTGISEGDIKSSSDETTKALWSAQNTSAIAGC